MAFRKEKPDSRDNLFTSNYKPYQKNFCCRISDRHHAGGILYACSKSVRMRFVFRIHKIVTSPYLGFCRLEFESAVF